MTAILENSITAAVTVAALALAFLALRAWRHAGGPRLALLAAAFGVLAAKGLFLSVLLFADPDWERPGLVLALLFDAAALGLFYVAVLRR